MAKNMKTIFKLKNNWKIKARFLVIKTISYANKNKLKVQEKTYLKFKFNIILENNYSVTE